VAGKTLLFLDEIQSCPDAIAALRYFYEDYPELHIVAAGSLLEFALAKLPSFGVGRIEMLFMYPFSFAEFLNACGASLLNEVINNANPNNPLPEHIHNMAVDYLRKFLIIGGMPEVVAEFAETGSLFACQKILSNLTSTLKTDFTKYKKRVPELRLNAIFAGIVQNMGQKIKYTNISNEYNLLQIKESIELLKMAGLVIPVTHTSANGIPLAAEINPKKQKLLLLDTGLYQNILGSDLSDILLANDFEVINKGSIAELFAGLELLKTGSLHTQNELYFWTREAKSSNAEVDYIVQQNDKIVPIEIKAGTKGSMQSLHLFMTEKQSELGIRCSLENFSHFDKIDVVPLYAIAKVKEVISIV
jgi:predicted AAA+ superfamily ATPase